MVRRGAASPDGSITRPVFLTQANQGIIAAMSDPSSKIITSFQDRLELDAALRPLGRLDLGQELRAWYERLKQRPPYRDVVMIPIR